MNILKNKKKILFLILIFIGIFAIKQNVFAKSASVTISPSNPKVGDTVTVTVGVSDVHTCQITASVSGVVSGEIKMVKGDLSGNKSSYSESKSFKVEKEGTINVNVSGNCVVDGKREDVSGSNSATVIKPEPTPEPTQNPSNPTPTPVPTKIPTETNPTQKPEEPKSSNNYLKALSINVGTLKPAFSRAINNYTVEFDNNFDLKNLKKIKISGDKENDKSTVEGFGEKTLTDGDNNFEIKVTAENGSVRTYTIKVSKQAPLTQSDLRIKSLEINTIDNENKFIKATLNEIFDSNVFDYTLDVGNNIVALDIDPKIDNEDITVTVEGSENLQSGENIVKIILASRDDENVKTVYTIKVNKAQDIEEVLDNELKEGKTESSLDKYKNIIIGIVAVIIILAIILGVLIFINHKGKKNSKDDKEKFGGDIKIKDLKDDKLFGEDAKTDTKKEKEQNKKEEENKKPTGKGKRFN